MSKDVSEERMQILKMVEEGRVTTEEGLELLNSLERQQDAIAVKKEAKWLKVRVKSDDNKTKVNVNIPVSLVDLGLKIGTAYAPELKKSGLDQINIKEIIEAVKNGAEGKIVEVEDEKTNTRVEVFVE